METSPTDPPLAVEPTEIVYPELPWRAIGRGGLRGALRLFGPGAIIASVSIASGEILFASRAGAIFGYGLLWFIVVCVGCKLVQVYTGARYMILTGEHPMAAWARLPGPRAWFPLLLGGLSLACFPFWLGGLSLMLGTALNWMFGMDHDSEASQRLSVQLFGTIALAAAVMITLFHTYRVLETLQTLIVGMLMLAILAALAVAPVDWWQVLRGITSVDLPGYADWVREKYPDLASRHTPLLTMVVFMGAIGGATYDYIGYLSLFRERAWGALAAGAGQPGPKSIALHPANIRTGRQWLRAPMIDVFTSFICVGAFTMAFNMLGAAILQPRHIIPDRFALLTPQVEFLSRFGAGFRYMYQLGVFMAFWGTIYGALEIYSRTVYESARTILPRVETVPFSRFRLPVCLYAGVGGLILIWTVSDPIRMVEPAALLGTTLCGIWCFAMVWADRRFLPRPLRMGVLPLVLNLLAGCVLTAFGLGAFSEYLRAL